MHWRIQQCQSGHTSPSSLLVGLGPQPAKNFAWAGGHWAIYNTYVNISITKSIVMRHILKSQNGQKCVGGLQHALRPLRSMIN